MLTSLESTFYWCSINWKRLRKDDKDQGQKSSNTFPSIGRTRGLIAVLDQTRREEETRLWRGDLYPNDKNPRLRQSGHFGSVMRNGSSKYQQGTWLYPSKAKKRKGRGLDYLLNSNPYPYPPSGMGRARSRDPGPHPFPEPQLQVPNMWPQCLCGNRLNTPPSPPASDTPYGTPSLESIMLSESPESGYEADCD